MGRVDRDRGGTFIHFIAQKHRKENSMQTTGKLRPAQAELQRTTHEQDLIEVPKRARLDREAEAKRDQQQIATRGFE
jgi:hypothetical protein